MSKPHGADAGSMTTDTTNAKKLNIDYTRVFQGMLGQEGHAFEHELVSFIHSILVQEPHVIT
jgi:hypothetical protein